MYCAVVNLSPNCLLDLKLVLWSPRDCVCVCVCVCGGGGGGGGEGVKAAQHHFQSARIS